MDDYNDDPSSSSFSKMSGKKLTAIAIIIVIGAVFGVQALLGFPLKDIIRKEITVEAKIVIKDKQGTCIVEPPDREPRSIPNCPYKVGDTLLVTYKEGTQPIDKYQLKG